MGEGEGFRIASAYVRVDANDEGLHEKIEAKVKEASEGIAARIRVETEAGGVAEKVRAEAAAASAEAHVHIQVDGDTRLALADLEAGARQLRGTFGELEAASRRAEDALDDVGTKAEGAGRKASESGDGFKWGAVGTGAMVTAALGLAPALVAIPAIAAGAGGAMVTLAAAFMPVIKALRDYSAEQTATGQSGAQLAATAFSDAVAIRNSEQSIADAKRQAARVTITSAEQVANAQQSLGDAERAAVTAAQNSADAIVSAQQRVAQAAYSSQQAEQSYTNSLWSEQQAQRSLMQARIDAANQLADSANAAADAHLAVEQAVLNVATAERNLTAAQGNSLLTNDQRLQADLAVRQAKQQLIDAKQRDAEATQKADQAQQQGVAHAPAVVSAQHAVEMAAQATAAAQHNITVALQGQTDAQHALDKAVEASANQRISSNEQVARAEQSLADAQRNADQQRADSAQSVARAEQNLADTITSQHLQAAAANSAASTAATQYHKDLKNLTGAGLDFVNTVEGMRGGLKELSRTAQDATLPGFTSMLHDSHNFLPVVNQGVHDMGMELGNTAAAFGHLFANPQFDQSARQFTTIVTSGFGQFASALPPLLNAIVTDGVKAAPIINQVAVGVHDLIATGLPSFFSGLAVNAGGAAQGVGAVFHAVDDLLGPVGTLVGAAAGALGPALADLEPGLAMIASDITKDLLPVMPQLSQDLVDVADIANQLFQIFQPIIPLIAHDLADALTAADPLLRDTATFLHDNQQWLTPVAEGILAVVAATKAWNIATGIGGGLLKQWSKAVELFGPQGKVAAASTKAWGVATSDTVVSLGKAVPIIGAVLLGAGALGTKLGELAGVGDHTALDVDHLTNSMYDASHGSLAAQREIEGLAAAMQFMSSHSMGNAIQGAKDIDAALVNLSQADAPAAAKEFDTLSASLEANGTSAADVAKLFPSYTQAVKDAATQAHIGAGTTNDLKDATRMAADTASIAAQASGPFAGLALRLQNVGQAGRNSDQDLKNLDAALKGIDAQVAKQQALDGYTKALNDMKDGAAGSSKEITGQSQAAIDNRNQLDQAVTSLRQYYDAQITAGANVDDANKSFDAQSDSLRKTAEKTYGSKKAVDDYLTSLGLVPKSLETTITAKTVDFKQAMAELDKLNAHRIATNSDIIIAYGGGHLALAGGGPVVGPGTKTSDSVPLWGSAGEWMMSADAVDYWGPGFMDAVNNKRMPSTPRVGGTTPRAAAPVVNLNYYGTQHPTPEQRQIIMRDLYLAVQR